MACLANALSSRGVDWRMVGEVLVKLMPALAELGQVYKVGIPHFTLDLQVLSLSFGLTLKLGLLAFWAS